LTAAVGSTIFVLEIMGSTISILQKLAGHNGPAVFVIVSTTTGARPGANFKSGDARSCVRRGVVVPRLALGRIGLGVAVDLKPGRAQPGSAMAGERLLPSR